MFWNLGEGGMGIKDVIMGVGRNYWITVKLNSKFKVFKGEETTHVFID